MAQLEIADPPTDDRLHDKVRIGTSGFSYADWRGTFYPPTIRDAHMLSFYAQQFDTVELNSTFYQLPALRSIEGMLRKVPEEFTFTVKAHRDLSHAREHSAETLPRFLEALKPFAADGKLACVLLQFPSAFRQTPENMHYLAGLIEQLRVYPTTVEFRHRSWIRDDIQVWLRDRGAGFCVVDLPELVWLPKAKTWVTSPVGYVRFHGRNIEKWRTKADRDERYDYAYSEAELQEWVPKLVDMVEATDRLLIYFNNHFRAQAAVNARMLKELLGAFLRGQHRRQETPVR